MCASAVGVLDIALRQAFVICIDLAQLQQPCIHTNESNKLWIKLAKESGNSCCIEGLLDPTAGVLLMSRMLCCDLGETWALFALALGSRF